MRTSRETRNCVVAVTGIGARADRRRIRAAAAAYACAYANRRHGRRQRRRRRRFLTVFDTTQRRSSISCVIVVAISMVVTYRMSIRRSIRQRFVLRRPAFRHIENSYGTEIALTIRFVDRLRALEFGARFVGGEIANEQRAAAAVVADERHAHALRDLRAIRRRLAQQFECVRCTLLQNRWRRTHERIAARRNSHKLCGGRVKQTSTAR